MTNTEIRAQYSTGLTRSDIEQALVAAGKDLENLQPSDLAMLEDFHTMGRIATGQLVDLLGILPTDHVLDAGSGVGGTARYVADQCGCTVSAVDLTADYCEGSRWLNRLVRLDGQISVRQADVTDLPFGDSTFQVIFSQHVQMNIADKTRLYREAYRVLAYQGRLAIWDVTTGGDGALDYPLPWADRAEFSYLVTPERLRAVVESAGFAIEHWEDLTDQAAATMQMILTMPPDPLGLHVFVPNFAEKADNLINALADGRLRVVRGIGTKTASGGSVVEASVRIT
ncbi:MAG: class I SAM-dependent methyltransferase [Mycobacterium sp.]